MTYCDVNSDDHNSSRNIESALSVRFHLEMITLEISLLSMVLCLGKLLIYILNTLRGICGLNLVTDLE